jgi:hypothetical protein
MYVRNNDNNVITFNTIIFVNISITIPYLLMKQHTDTGFGLTTYSKLGEHKWRKMDSAKPFTLKSGNEYCRAIRQYKSE